MLVLKKATPFWGLFVTESRKKFIMLGKKF